MGATFNIYNTATTGMYVNQASLSVVSNNLSNINTPGYSRKEILCGEKAVLIPGEKSYGSGAGVLEIYRSRDRFLDQTYRQENGKTQYYNRKNAILEDAQKLLNEYGSRPQNGLQQTIKEFFNSWDQLIKDPSSQATRKSVVGYAGALANVCNQINNQLTQMKQDAGNRVKDGVDSLNSLAKQVVSLNKQISQAEKDGGENGNLRDQRDALLDKMSAIASISVNEQPNGDFCIRIGSVALVQGDTVHTLQYSGNGREAKVEWAQLDIAAEFSGGSIKANLEEAQPGSITKMDDSKPWDFRPEGCSFLADLGQGLNELLSTVANKVNSLLCSGKDLNGNSGVELFVKIDSSKPLEAGNIKVNDVIAADVSKIAAGTSGAPSDGTIAAKIKGLQDEKVFSYNGRTMTVTDYYQALISWTATEGDRANGNYDTQRTLLQQAKNQRDSVACVYQDEEIAKMITYQNAYNASARVLSTVDKLIGELIAAMGR